MSGRETFEEFVAARRPTLLRTAYLLTGSRHDAEELLQTTLLKIVPTWARIADLPDPHVQRVLARESTSRRRRRRWRRGEGSTPTPPRAERPPSGSRDREERERLRQGLLALSPRQRAVVVLRHHGDLTERETAEHLGVSVASVKSDVREALARLRNTVPEEDLRRSAPAGP